MLALQRPNHGVMDCQVLLTSGSVSFPLFVAQVPIGAVPAPLSPSGCWQHIPCPVLAVCTGKGCQVWPGLRSLEFSALFPHEGTSAKGKGCLAPPVLWDELGTQLCLSFLRLGAEYRTWPFLGLYMLFVLPVGTLQIHIL